jgi:prephenate dehydrogenase
MGSEIFFLGLNQIGTSIGLALAEPESQVDRVGYDPDSNQARSAHQAGAVDRLVSHPRKASTTADVVILDVPAPDVHEYLKMLSQQLKTDGVVIDTTPLKAPAAAWAEETFPADRHYIGATLIVGPEGLLPEAPDLSQPRADLFEGGLMALVVPPKTPENAVKFALSLAAVLDASPFFIGPVEHDAVYTSIEWIPRLLGAALMRQAAGSPSWREIRRMAGPGFASMTKLGTSTPSDLQAHVVSSARNHILDKMDTLMSELQDLRVMLAKNDEKAFEEYYAEAASTFNAWITARKRSDWASLELQPYTVPPKEGARSGFLGLSPRGTKKRQ